MILGIIYEWIEILKMKTVIKTPGMEGWFVGWLVWFYGISTFVGYLTPNPFLC